MKKNFIDKIKDLKKSLKESACGNWINIYNRIELSLSVAEKRSPNFIIWEI